MWTMLYVQRALEGCGHIWGYGILSSWDNNVITIISDYNYDFVPIEQNRNLFYTFISHE